jgi:glucosamine kinase
MALARDEQRYDVTLGPANIATDFDAAMAVLRDGIAQLAQAAALPVGTLAGLPATLALAGVVEDRDGARVTAALGLARARVIDDRTAAVRGALGGRDGSVAGLGTGSFFARVSGGRMRCAGGWGARLGDEASGFWLGREALRLTLETIDGLRPASDLTSDMLARTGGSARGIVDFAATATPDGYAALAPAVIAAAGAGDPAAREIVIRGAAHVTGMIRRLDHTPGQPLCLTGGLAGAYALLIARPLAEDLAPAISGALDAALEMARSDAL